MLHERRGSPLRPRQGERERRLAADNVSKGIGDYTRDEVSLALGFGTGAAAGGMTAALGAAEQNRYLKDTARCRPPPPRAASPARGGARPAPHGLPLRIEPCRG